MCGTSQRFPPAHFNGGLSLDILLAFEVGAGGETRTLMRSEPRQILRALPRTTIYIFRPFHLFSAFSFHNDSLKRRCVLQMRPSLEKRCVYMSRERKGSIVEPDGGGLRESSIHRIGWREARPDGGERTAELTRAK